MAKYQHIKRKIKSVKSTKQITKAMELVSASKLRRAQERLLATRPYQNQLQEIISSLAEYKESVDHPLMTGREVKTRGLIMLVSDRGLCGAYNTNLLKLAQQWIEEGETPVKVISIGSRASDFFKKLEVEVLEHFHQPNGKLEINELRPIANRLLSAFEAEEIDSAHIVFAKFRSALINIPTVKQLMPVESTGDDEDSGGRGELLFEPEPKVILGNLLPRIVTMELLGYMAESFTSEHGARMVAMQNATKSATEMIDNLTLQFNRARQTSITQEILEVVSGANALE